MATKTRSSRKQPATAKEVPPKLDVIQSDEIIIPNCRGTTAQREPRWRLADVITPDKLTAQVLLHEHEASSVKLFCNDEPEVYRTSQVARNEIARHTWQPHWPMELEAIDALPCPLARLAVDRAVIAAVRMVDWKVLAGLLPPTVMMCGQRGTHAMLSVLKWAVEELGHTHGVQADLAEGGNGGDFTDAIGDLEAAGLDNDLVFVNTAILRAEQSGRSVIDHSPITEVLGELQRHRILDQHELSIDDVITLRQGSELLVMGKSHDVVTSEWNRVSQTARQAGFELCPRYEPEQTDLNGWEREVAGFGVGVADNEVTIMMPVRAYADLEFKLEKAACSPNPQRGARFAIEHWLSWQAPGLESQAKTDTIAEMSQVVRRTGFAAVISELELSAAYDRNLQRWICDRDDEHIESFLQAVDACSYSQCGQRCHR